MMESSRLLVGTPASKKCGPWKKAVNSANPGFGQETEQQKHDEASWAAMPIIFRPLISRFWTRPSDRRPKSRDAPRPTDFGSGYLLSGLVEDHPLDSVPTSRPWNTWVMFGSTTVTKRPAWVDSAAFYKRRWHSHQIQAEITEERREAFSILLPPSDPPGPRPAIPILNSY
jgi:hypothetical protein